MADSNSPPTTSSPLPTDDHHNDTPMVDSPAETPDHHTGRRPSAAGAPHSEASGIKKVAHGGRTSKKGSKDEKDKDPFGEPGSCWKNEKYQEEVARWEEILVHADWNMSQFPDPLEER